MKRELTRLIAGQVCLHACMTGMRMAAPLMALRTGQSPAAVGVLLSMFALSQVFLALPAGRFTDRHGLHRPMLLSVVTACVGAALATAFPIFPVLCLSALMTGGAAGLAVIALQRHVGRLAQDLTQLKLAFSWLAIGPAFSNFIGPFVAGLLIDFAGFRVAYAAMGGLALMAWGWIRRSRELPPVGVSNVKPRAWDLLADPMFRRLLLVNWALSVCWDVHTFVVPILGHERQLSASAIGTILGSFAIAAALIRMLLPWFAARYAEWQVILGAMAMTMLLLLLYPFMHSALAMGLCSVMLGFSLGGVQPMVMSTLHQITPESRHGEALGLRLMGINASSVLMPMLFGAAGTVIGVAGVFWCTAATLLPGMRGAMHLRVRKSRK